MTTPCHPQRFVGKGLLFLRTEVLLADCLVISVAHLRPYFQVLFLGSYDLVSPKSQAMDFGWDIFLDHYGACAYASSGLNFLHFHLVRLRSDHMMLLVAMI